MKITTLQPQVKLNTSGNAQIGASRDINAYGGNQYGSNNLGKAFSQVGNFIDREMEDKMAIDVLAAQTEYKNQIREVLHNQETGILNRKGEYAANVDKDFESKEREIRNQVLKKLPSYAKAHMAFNNLANEYSVSSMAVVSEHQNKQREFYEDLTRDNAIEATLKDASYSDPKNYDKLMADFYKIGSVYHLKKFGPEAFEAFMSACRRQVGTTYANQAWQQKDYVGLDNVLNTYGKDIEPNALAKFKGGLKEEIEKDNIYREFSNIKSMFTKADGSFDEEAADKYVESSFGVNSRKTINKKSNIKSKTDFFAAVAKQESGGNYEAQNARTGAFGKYQIMPENWPKWSVEAGLPENADINDPENQEVVAKFKLGQYFDRYGAEGALVAWYAGEVNGQRWVDRAADAIGEDGNYSWDAKQGKGDEPSVRQYVQESLAHVSDNQMNETSVSNFDRVKYESLRQKVKAYGVELHQNKAMKNHEELEAVKNGLVELKGSPTAQLELIDNSSLEPYVKESLKSSVIQGSRRTESEPAVLASLYKLRAFGQLTEKDVLNQTRFLTQDDYLKLMNDAYKIDAGKHDKLSASADKRWIARLESEVINSKESKQLVAQISDLLDRENLSGDAREARALKHFSDIGSSDSKKALINFSYNNIAEDERINKAFDPNLVRLTYRGLEKEFNRKPTAWEVNAFLSGIGAEINNGNSVYQEAIDIMLQDGIPINTETFNKYRSKL